MLSWASLPGTLRVSSRTRGHRGGAARPRGDVGETFLARPSTPPRGRLLLRKTREPLEPPDPHRAPTHVVARAADASRQLFTNPEGKAFGPGRLARTSQLCQLPQPVCFRGKRPVKPARRASAEAVLAPPRGSADRAGPSAIAQWAPQTSRAPESGRWRRSCAPGLPDMLTAAWNDLASPHVSVGNALHDAAVCSRTEARSSPACSHRRGTSRQGTVTAAPRITSRRSIRQPKPTHLHRAHRALLASV